jgi:uncharacterized membrane protein YbaN (DUF454 family)
MYREEERTMSNQDKANMIFIGIGFIALGLGIYGLSDSILAAIALPISACSFLIWRSN